VLSSFTRPLLPLLVAGLRLLGLRLSDRVGQRHSQRTARCHDRGHRARRGARPGVWFSSRDGSYRSGPLDRLLGYLLVLWLAADIATRQLPVISLRFSCWPRFLRSRPWLWLRSSCASLTSQRPRRMSRSTRAFDAARFSTATSNASCCWSHVYASNSSDAFLLLRAQSEGVSIAAIPLLWAMLHVSKVVVNFRWRSFGSTWPSPFDSFRLDSLRGRLCGLRFRFQFHLGLDTFPDLWNLFWFGRGSGKGIGGRFGAT